MCRAVSLIQLSPSVFGFFEASCLAGPAIQSAYSGPKGGSGFTIPRRKYMTGFGKSKKYCERFMEKFNGMIIRRGLLRNEKKRDAGPKISPSLSSKRASSLFTKSFSALAPHLFWESRSSHQATAFAGFRTLRRSEPNPPKTERSILSIKIYVLFSAGQNG